MAFLGSIMSLGIPVVRPLAQSVSDNVSGSQTRWRENLDLEVSAATVRTVVTRDITLELQR
jgi:hypothetical protein